MGSHMQVVLGPYLQVKSKKDIVNQEQVLTCSDTNCKNHQKNIQIKSKFCPDCGAGTSIKEYSIVYKASADSVASDEYELFEDKLYSPEYQDNILIPNQYSPSKIRIDSDGSGAINLMEVDFQKDIDWFKNKYQEQIERIIEVFGKSEVEIKFGIVYYWS